MTHTKTGHFKTPNASKYLQQLCKHFAHKVEVRYDPTSAEVAFPMGQAVLKADDTRLEAVVTGSSEDEAIRAQGIIDSHLVRFAFREDFVRMDWA